jgi:periodic tryptophan protein 1
VKRGLSARHPSKQPLNDADVERIKEIAHIELEDARTELERANAAAQSISQRNGSIDDSDDDEDDSAWVEYVSLNSYYEMTDSLSS